MIGNEYGKNLDCPICDGGIPNDQRKGEYVGALSRFDNKTEVCSACGTMEALVDWVSREEWQRASVREDWAHWKVTVLRMKDHNLGHGVAEAMAGQLGPDEDVV
tara:strand:- start:1872 stop:2183 length:312 start_codon:yes stop_codon:yes gene_type:complete